jgi:hypothetical protein
METGNKVTAKQRADQGQEVLTTKAGRSSPIVLASIINLMNLQKELKIILKGSFEFRTPIREKE